MKALNGIKWLEQIEIAREVEVHPKYLNAVLCRHREASILLALKIEKATGGKIKAVELRPDIKQYL